MSVVKKPAVANTNKVATPVKPATTATTKTAPVKPATTAKPVTKTAPTKPATPVKPDTSKKNSVAKNTAPAKTETTSKKNSVAKKQNTSSSKGGKMGSIKLTAAKPSKTFDIKLGGQATQEAFIDRFYKRLVDLGYEVTKEMTKSIQKAYSETLKDVTNIASFQDTTSGIFYGRRMIDTRITTPPKAANGLQTLMLIHPEVKVRKQLGDESKIKFFGHLSDDDANIFITDDGEEINIAETEKALLAEYDKATTKSTSKKPAVTKTTAEETEEVTDEEETVEDETVEEDLVEEDEDVTDETEELEEELEEEETEEDSELFDEEEE